MKLTGINHLVFITGDMVRTIRFYRDLLGMELTFGVGRDGIRRYVFTCGNTRIAFFEYAGATPPAKKPQGMAPDEPLCFDHVAFTVATRDALYDAKDQLEAAGIEVHGAVDHSTIWSIYFFDPVNNIPLEVSWDCMEITGAPAMDDINPLAIVDEGAAPQPGHWPMPTRKTSLGEMRPWPGNDAAMRGKMVAAGLARTTSEYDAIPEDLRSRVGPTDGEAAE